MLCSKAPVRNIAQRIVWGLPTLLSVCCATAQTTPARLNAPLPSTATSKLTTPSESTFFSTAAEEAYSTYQLSGDGDLWPSCWADDGNLYAANGDGAAFTGGQKRYDMAVSAISGMPPDLKGTTVATNLGTNWSGVGYNRKPTGMLCIKGTLYLAFQNLNSSNFSDAPAASIAKSTDYGATWTWNQTSPMFGAPGAPGAPNAYKFTTIFFLDFGKDSAHAIDGYVYAYGLDNNWREQRELYLARVPNNKIQTRADWEFYAGTDSNGGPVWSRDVARKAPVLTDTRLLYPKIFGGGCPANQAVIGQGGVVYDVPLKRYIFASWSCATHEFYEAPKPWGPWRHFLSNDFGPLRSMHNRGQYGTSIPSKFISADGKTLYLQSNVCCGGDSYTFSLRKVYLQRYSPSLPDNGLSSVNLAMESGTQAISKSTRFGQLCGLNCSDQLNSGILSGNEDDYDEETKTIDWWGYVWPRAYNLNHVIYETGDISTDGGWYANDLHVQIRSNFQWIDVPGTVTVWPPYPYNGQVRDHSTYTFNLPDVCGDGVRIIGTAGGRLHFTSISQLGVYYGGGSLKAALPATCKPARTSPKESVGPSR